MPDLRTTITELVTGLGTLGYDSAGEAIGARPAEMVSVSPETWELLERAHAGGALAASFELAWSNGVAFARAREGLRERRPIVIEWKGSQRAPGDEVAPIDLRIDHVYLISCKYLSKITINASPSHLFQRLLQGPHGVRGGDWYEEVAPDEYRQLYESVLAELGWSDLPADVGRLSQAQRTRLSDALSGGWPPVARAQYEHLANVVAHRTAEHWLEALATTAQSEAMLWRILRMGGAPYYMLGASPAGPLRLRVATPWDWRASFRLRRFECAAQEGGQPRVGWTATIEDRHSATRRIVRGHVEVRWSHGRFGGNPEAKVYLDTAHGDVPGYFPLN
ncbi:MAG: hypothetical protein ACRDZ8_05750 [Acidimicrobiales bacterium]